MSFAISGGVDSDRFMLENYTGVLHWAGQPDYENPLDANGDNLYEIEVSVSDGELVQSEQMQIRVTNGILRICALDINRFCLS